MPKWRHHEEEEERNGVEAILMSSTWKWGAEQEEEDVTVSDKFGVIIYVNNYVKKVARNGENEEGVVKKTTTCGSWENPILGEVANLHTFSYSSLYAWSGKSHLFTLSYTDEDKCVCACIIAQGRFSTRITCSEWKESRSLTRSRRAGGNAH